MKFSAKLTDPSSILQFSKLMLTISKLCKSCTLHILPNSMRLMLSNKLAAGEPVFCCDLDPVEYFASFQMEGLSPESNEIYLELNPDNVVRALKSPIPAKLIKIKLTKKHTVCLTFEVELASLTANYRQVVHDVPVGVVNKKNWTEFKEPIMNQCDLSICMPPLKIVKNVAEKMKNISSFVTLEVSSRGDLTMKVDTDAVDVVTYFHDLPIPQDGEEGAIRARLVDELGDRNLYKTEASVDIRKLSPFFTGLQLNPTRTICNIVHNKTVQFAFATDGIKMRYYVPACIL